MKLFNNQILILLFSSFIFLSGSVFAVDLGFFRGDDDGEVIWEINTNVYLKYATQDKSVSIKNDHPAELNEETIRKALELLVVQQVDFDDDSDKGSVSVFTATEMSLLSKNIARGLIKARPDQDIIFALKKSRDRFLSLKKAQFFDAGRVFFKDGKLNIIIGDYDRAREEGYENAYDPTHMGIVAYNFNHGTRLKSAKKFKEPIVEVDGIELKDSQRPDWFVIDLNVASKVYDLQTRAREKNELEGKRKELREILGEDAISGTSAKERAQNSKERREMRAEMARMRKEMSERSGTASSSQSLEERLKTLDQLKKKGLVSDKEYQIKRKEILNDI